MSTHISELYREYERKSWGHIYRDMNDDKFYIETEEGTLKLPKEFIELLKVKGIPTEEKK